MHLFRRSDDRPEKKSRITRTRSLESPEPAVNTEEQFGLFELWPDTPSGEADRVHTVMDIVAVHGLGGHPYKTWTEGQKLWLRDFLPKDVPDVRVFTFGYNSSIAFGGTASRIDDFAMTLLERLLQKRKPYKDMTRPVIFICHSLGGIVFKRALVMAHAHSSRYQSLVTAIKSVIFMGTPHRGADIANWSGILGRLANVPMLGSIRTDLLKDLQPKSKLLMTISSDFVERGANLSIFSFYERKFLPGFQRLIVDKDSAILNQQNETPMPTEANHHTICKFLTSNTEAYALVFDCLSELIDAAKGEDDSWLSVARANFMNSLWLFDQRNILSQIPRPLKCTCSWIAQDPEFQRWQTPSSTAPKFSENCRVLHMHGPPGVGKTVMSSYIITHLRQTLKMNKQPQKLVYFFCDDKDPKRRTSLNLLGSLLFQVLVDDEQLLQYVSEDAIETDLQNLRDNLVESENLHDVWDSLLAIFQRSRATHFWFIIDAVDELEPTSRADVIHQFNRILDSDTIGRLKILFTDRRTPRYQFPNQAIIELGASESQDDVRTYIRHSVTQLGNKVPIETKFKAVIEDEIVMMANGTILHASLAFANFTQGVTDWTPRVIRTRLKDLQKLPASLEAYYAGLLRHIPADFQPKARKAFIWVLGSISRAPLTLKELHHAVSVNDHQEAWSDLLEDLGYNFESSIQEACGYMLKIDANGFVAFSHQTVKELFESTRVSAREIDEEVLRTYRITPKDIDMEIVQTCTRMLQFKDFNRYHVGNTLISAKDLYHDYCIGSQDRLVKRMKTFPFLQYAIRYWSHFGDVLNEGHVVRRLHSFFESFQVNYFRIAAALWTQNTRVATPAGVGLLPPELPPLHHCIQTGDFPKTVLALIASGANVNELDVDGMSPLHWACNHGNKATIVELLNNPRLDPNIGLPGQNRPIHVALKWVSWPSKHTESIEIPLLILKDRRTDVNAVGSFSETPLHVCLRHGGIYTAISDFLLDQKEIDLNAMDGNCSTPFTNALNRPEHEYIFLKMLKNPNVRLDQGTDASSANRLSIVGRWGWKDAEAALIGINVDQVFAIADDGFNYLTRFAFYGRKQAVSRILDMLKDEGERLRESVGEGANSQNRPQASQNSSRKYQLHPTVLNRMPPGSDFNDQYRIFHHLLHICAHQDWEDVATILEERFDIHGLPHGDHIGRTMLHWAVENDWDYAMRNFSDRPKSWIDHQDRDGMTALHIACVNQNHQVARHLVNLGANYFLKNGLGKNPAHIVAETGCRSISVLFINESTREYGRDKEGRSLLHFLVMWQRGPLIEHFIKAKTPIIDVLDKKRRTPLFYAALYNNNEALEVLLHHGAKVNHKDSNGSIPLHQSLAGSATTASLLIGWDAKLKSIDGFHQTCLQIALRSQRKDTIELIISHIGDWEHRLDKRGWQFGHRATLDMIRNRDFQGKTALHRACAAYDYSKQHTTMKDVFTFVKTLIEYGAEVNAQDNFGYTPAHVAASGNNSAAMTALLHENPDLALFDHHTCTALDWALVQGQTEMADILRRAGGVSTRGQGFAMKLGGFQPPKPEEPMKQYDPQLWAVALILDDREERRNKRDNSSPN